MKTITPIPSGYVCNGNVYDSIDVLYKSVQIDFPNVNLIFCEWDEHTTAFWENSLKNGTSKIRKIP